MSNHPDDALLHDFVDGRLADEERDSVAFHLLDCPRCQAIVAATEELIDTGRSATRDASAPADLWPLVAATTIHERAVKRHVLKSMRKELGIAAAVLMLLSGAAGAFGMRIAMRAEDGFGPNATARIERIAPEIAISRSLEALEQLEALEHIRVEAVGGGTGIGGHMPGVPAAPAPPDPPDASGPISNETARAMAAEYIGQMMDRETRAFESFRRQSSSHRRVAEVEDSVFDSNRRLLRLRAAYIDNPDDKAIADELESLFEKRIALIRKAAAEAEASARAQP